MRIPIAPRGFLLLALFLGLRLVFWVIAFPNPDEAYYWLWGQHPDWSYYDHPPLLAWVNGLITAGLGRSTFSLRLPNLVANGLLFYLYYRIVAYLYGKQAPQAFWIVVLSILASPLYFLFLALAWPDYLMITCCLGAAYGLITFLDGYLENQRGESWRLYLAAAAIGLGMLAKYNTLFVVLGFLATLVSDRRFWPLARDRRLYLAGAIALCALGPIVFWNASHNFPSFRYYVSRSADGGGTTFKVGETLGFLALSLVTVSPFQAVALWRGFQRFVKSGRSTSVYTTVAFWVFILSTGLLAALALVSTALYYWNINAYLLLFPLIPAMFLPPAAEERSGSLPRSSLFWSGQIYGLLFALLLVVHYGLIPLSALFGPEGDPDSRMLYGWPGVATEVRRVTAEMGSPFLLTTDYRSGAALAYELDQKQVSVISNRISQFTLWYDPAKLRGRDGVILYDDWHPITPEILAQFDRTSAPETIAAKRFGLGVKNYFLVRGYGFRG